MDTGNQPIREENLCYDLSRIELGPPSVTSSFTNLCTDYFCPFWAYENSPTFVEYSEDPFGTDWPFTPADTPGAQKFSASPPECATGATDDTSISETLSVTETEEEEILPLVMQKATRSCVLRTRVNYVEDEVLDVLPVNLVNLPAAPPVAIKQELIAMDIEPCRPPSPSFLPSHPPTVRAPSSKRAPQAKPSARPRGGVKKATRKTLTKKQLAEAKTRATAKAKLKAELEAKARVGTKAREEAAKARAEAEAEAKAKEAAAKAARTRATSAKRARANGKVGLSKRRISRATKLKTTPEPIIKPESESQPEPQSENTDEVKIKFEPPVSSLNVQGKRRGISASRTGFPPFIQFPQLNPDRLCKRRVAPTEVLFH